MTTQPSVVITQDTVLARLAALQTMPITDLKTQWRSLFGTEPPPFNRAYIQSRLAYRIQELAYGGLNWRGGTSTAFGQLYGVFWSLPRSKGHRGNHRSFPDGCGEPSLPGGLMDRS